VCKTQQDATQIALGIFYPNMLLSGKSKPVLQPKTCYSQVNENLFFNLKKCSSQVNKNLFFNLKNMLLSGN
jgi:hypothetical protein